MGVLSCDTPLLVKNGDGGGKFCNFRPAMTGVHVIRSFSAPPPVVFLSSLKL